MAVVDVLTKLVFSTLHPHLHNYRAWPKTGATVVDLSQIPPPAHPFPSPPHLFPSLLLILFVLIVIRLSPGQEKRETSIIMNLTDKDRA